jgi:hypothetical protein
MIGLAIRTVVAFAALLGAMALAGLAQPSQAPRHHQEYAR